MTQFEYAGFQTVNEGGITSVGCNLGIKDGPVANRIIFNAVMPDSVSSALYGGLNCQV